MYFIDQRIQVICNQLQMLRFRDSRSLPDWEYKPGQFFRPEEADAAQPDWAPFDCQHMHWYAAYAGTDQFDLKASSRASTRTSMASPAATIGSAAASPSPRTWTESPSG